MDPRVPDFFYHYFRCFALFATTGRSGLNDRTIGLKRPHDRASTTARCPRIDQSMQKQRPHNFLGTYRHFFSFLLSGDQQGRITVTEETEVMAEGIIVDGPPVAFDKG